MPEFDQLIKDGKTAEALRHFANEGYKNGFFGFTRKQLIEHSADEVDRLRELETLIEEMDKLRIKMGKSHLETVDNIDAVINLNKHYRAYFNLIKQTSSCEVAVEYAKKALGEQEDVE